MPSIGDRLKSERKRFGLSQDAFAEIGGVKLNAQGNYEAGRRIPKADYLARLDSAGIDVLYVLTGRRSKQVNTHRMTRRHTADRSAEPAKIRPTASYATDVPATISAPLGGIAMPSDPMIALLYRLNENSNAIASAVEEIGQWIDQRGSTDVSGRVEQYLGVLEENSEMVTECLAELLFRSQS